MSLICVCPPSAAPGTIEQQDCLFKIRQVQKFGVQRTYNGATLNTIDISTNNPNLLATWTALKGAVDSTKVQFSPFIQEPTSEAGEARVYGGGNTTLDGAEIPLGASATPFSAYFLDMPPKVIKSIKVYNCEAALSVFLINEFGAIIGIVDDLDTPTTFRGIPLQPSTFFVGDLSMGQFENPEKNMVRWSFPSGWSDNLYQIAPSDFDAKRQL